MVKNTVDKIAIEVRCVNCGKLLFKIFKKGIDKRIKNDIIVVRCNRCSADNNIKI